MSTSQPGALDGVRVVALEQAVAAPLCTRHLADLGADVTKIERPPGGDFARSYDSAVHGESAYFVWLNYGKQSIDLDLATATGRATFERLLASADVFVHNVGPGAVARLGYGWDVIHARWPRLISCGISGFGSDGPYRDRKAFDLLIQGESGLLSVTGAPDEPARVGVSIGDISAGVYAVVLILAALRQRDQTGSGQECDVSMLDCLAEWMAVPGLFQRYTSVAPSRSGLHHPTIAPYGPYRAADGPPVMLAVQNAEQWQRLCERVLDAPALSTDERFASNERRVANRSALDTAIAQQLGSISRGELVRRLTDADVPFGALNDVAAVLDHPQLVSRNRWVDVGTPSGRAIVPRSPLGDGARRRVPALGEDRPAIIDELAQG